MSKIKILLFILITIIFFNGCSTLKDGFRSQKKNSIDEFMVEKKSPLIMPPNYDELPFPNQDNQVSNNNNEADIKSLISNNEDSSNQTKSSSTQDTNFEKSILEKIKKN